MEQIIKIKCPYCGLIQSINIQMYHELGATDITRGIGNELRNIVTRIKSILDSKDINDTGAWLDMPPCSHCGKSYRYNVRTYEVTL